MKPSRPMHLAVIAFSILGAVIACALPGQPIQSAPDLNPITIESAVAGTAQAAAQQTKQAQPIAATATATTIPADALIAPEVISIYETSLVKRGDGSTQFRDYRAGVQIIFPPNWLAVRAGEPEYYEAWEKVATQNEALFDSLTLMQSDDQNTFRVNAYDLHAEHFLYGGFPRMNVVFAQGDLRTLKELEADEKYKGAHSILTGYKLLLADYKEIPAGLEILDFQFQWDSSDSKGIYEDYIALYRAIMFKVPTGTVAIQIFIPFDQKEALSLEQDKIVESVTLFNP